MKDFVHVQDALKALPYEPARLAIAKLGDMEEAFRMVLGGPIEIGEEAGTCQACELPIFEWPEGDYQALDVDGDWRVCADCYPAEHAKMLEHLRLHPEDAAGEED